MTRAHDDLPAHDCCGLVFSMLILAILALALVVAWCGVKQPASSGGDQPVECSGVRPDDNTIVQFARQQGQAVCSVIRNGKLERSLVGQNTGALK